VVRQTLDEVAFGRLSQPCLAQQDTILTRRFPVLQRTSKGSLKIRVIDDFKESKINSLCSVRSKIRMGSVATLVQVTQLMWRRHPAIPICIGKSDFSHAYRTCPIMQAHLPFSRILININDQVMTCTQHATPFGAISAVYA
jgi:hypothetical protein